MVQNGLLVGIARRVISPPPGIFLVGYGDRSMGNRGVHDDLTATALVLDDGRMKLAVVACDLLCLNEYIIDRVRRALEPEIHPVICCSHTHSGAIGYADDKSGWAERAYIHALVRSILEAIRQAAEQAEPARLEFSQAQADIAVNRRQRETDGKVIIGENPSGVVDHSVNIISVVDEAGARLATLVNYACHGTVLGPDNLLVSADWIGVMRSKVENELGGLALFLQGATGDLNPKMGWGTDKVWEMLSEQGERVADVVIQAVHENAELVQGLPLGILRQEVWLPFEAQAENFKPPTTYRKRILGMAGLPAMFWPLTDWLLDKRYPWKPRLKASGREFEGAWTTPLRVNVVRLGDVAMVTFGSETFTEIGIQVKAASPARHTLFASVSDGCIGYLATAEAHAQGGYEVDMAPYAYRFPGRLARECAEIAMSATQRMLSELWFEKVEV